MIEFILEDKEINKQLTLDDVEENQFFIRSDGALCQKSHFHSYNVISKPNGCPLSFSEECYPEEPIQKILPKVKKIVF